MRKEILLLYEQQVLSSDYRPVLGRHEFKGSAAIKSLSSAALRDTRNPDIQNYLGYAYRHTGQFDLAFKHYARALQLNPRHRGGTSTWAKHT